MAALQPPKAELWGATLAVRHLDDFWKLLNEAQEEPGEPHFVVLSFSGINSVSPSYLKRFLVQIFEVESEGSNASEIYPVITALTADLRDDLASFLNERGLVIREVEIEESGVTHVQFVGDLERVARQTLEALDDVDEATAVEIHAKYDHLGIAQTAWNNRLANLHRMRLATRRKQGRSLFYQSALKSNTWAKA